MAKKAQKARRGVNRNHLFTSESVSMGHPDKVADQVSDAILDAMLAQDRRSRVACETMVTTGMVLVAGEITSKAVVDIPAVVGGDLGAAYDVFVAGLRESLYGQASALATRELLIAPATHGEQSGVVGCAALALREVLDSATVDQALAERGQPL